jgi:tRNA-Thr(GGU) m(6)t(6)A37 methyltransferase TsaA
MGNRAILMTAKAYLKFIGEVETVEPNFATMRIFPPYLAALHGITAFSPVIILYWLHHRDTEARRKTLKVRPKRHMDAPESGVFATRSPDRPNPLGLTVTELVARNEDVLIVEPLDAQVGTPIIDIKPYIPRADCVPEAIVPEWTHHGPRT